MTGTTNAFEMAQQQFDHVAKLLKLDPRFANCFAGQCANFISVSRSAWITGPSVSFRAIASNTMTPADQTRVAFVSIRQRQLTPFAPWRPG